MLALSRTDFSDVGAEAVANHCKDLEVLDLGVNSSALTDAGAVSIAGGCRSLHTLKLAETWVTDVGASAIAACLHDWTEDVASVPDCLDRQGHGGDRERVHSAPGDRYLQCHVRHLDFRRGRECSRWPQSGLSSRSSI
jgi:hypothetical protein